MLDEKSEKKESSSVAQTSIQETTALKETTLQDLIQRQKGKYEITQENLNGVLDNPSYSLTVSTGRRGYIELQLALTNEGRRQLGRPPLTEQETTALIEKWEKELPDGFYRIEI